MYTVVLLKNFCVWTKSNSTVSISIFQKNLEILASSTCTAITQKTEVREERSQLDSSTNEKAGDSFDQSAVNSINQSKDIVANESTDDVIMFQRPTLDRNTYRRTYSKKGDWAIGDEELLSISGGTVKPV